MSHTRALMAIGTSPDGDAVYWNRDTDPHLRILGPKARRLPLVVELLETGHDEITLIVDFSNGALSDLASPYATDIANDLAGAVDMFEEALAAVDVRKKLVFEADASSWRDIEKLRQATVIIDQVGRITLTADHGTDAEQRELAQRARRLLTELIAEGGRYGIGVILTADQFSGQTMADLSLNPSIMGTILVGAPHRAQSHASSRDEIAVSAWAGGGDKPELDSAAAVLAWNGEAVFTDTAGRARRLNTVGTTTR